MEVAENEGKVEFIVTAYNQNKTSSINPGRSVTVQFTPDEVNSKDFLSDTDAGADKTAVLNFVQTGALWTAKLPVNLDNDSSPEETGEIMVTLKDDPALIDTYTLSNTEADKSAKATIWDDDAPELSIIAGPAVIEGPDVKATFKVISNVMPSAAAIPINFSPVGAAFITASGTPIEANPGISFVRNINTGKYEGTIEIDIVDDDLNEPDGNVEVTLNSVTSPKTYYEVSPVSARITVSDNDQIPSVIVRNLAPSFDEDAGTISIPIELSNPITQTVMIDWETSDGTAVKDSDYEHKDETLEIASGTSGMIQIPIKPDDIYEGNETFTITLSNPVNAIIPGSSGTIEITVTIEDGEEKPTVKFANSTANITEDHADEKISLGVELVGNLTSNDVVVTYETSSRTGTGFATAGNDFIASTTNSNTATISAGDRTGIIEIEIEDDELDEPDETFIVTISNPQNAVLSNTAADSSVTSNYY